MGEFFGGFIVAFVYNWKLTLVMMSSSPLIVVFAWLIVKVRDARGVIRQAFQYLYDIVFVRRNPISKLLNPI